MRTATSNPLSLNVFGLFLADTGYGSANTVAFRLLPKEYSGRWEKFE
jgi:hypothetical protein